MQSQKISSYILAAAIVLLLPLVAIFEHKENPTWSTRLFAPAVVSEPNRHTPAITAGTFLPPIIQKNTTLTAAQNPVISSHMTEVAPTATLTINPGVNIYTHEYAGLLVKGSLTIAGTEAEPVTFTTNETNKVNQFWAGLITVSGGKTSINHARIAFASPAISCAQGSIVNLKNSQLEDGNTGIWQDSPNCSSEHITYKRIRDNIIIIK